MKKSLPRVAVALLLALLLPLAVHCLLISAEEGWRISDETGRTATQILAPNGASSGVAWTRIAVGGSVYGKNREVNVVEFDLADPHLSVEVLNSGSYMVSSRVLTAAAADYNRAHAGQTVLAAINGDLWMTSVHCEKVTTATLKVPRGVVISDGEIWATQQIDQENLEATNIEKGTPAGDKYAFGVTSQNQPLVGSPDIRLTVRGAGKTIEADGLNRLPARDALIVYNHRLNSSNYALNDAYEVELTITGDAAFTVGGSVYGTVKAIYPAGSATRPAINSDTLLLTARGSRISELQNAFAVGSTVSVQVELTDRLGRTELWQDVKEAIGGHMQTVINGEQAIVNPDTTAYPTAIVGYRSNGTVVMATFTSALDNSRAALRGCDAYRFCTELGLNSAFYLDGGGSATLATLENGSYTVRNKCSDGSPRAVINGLGVVWNDTPVCEKQGSLSHIRVPIDYSGIDPLHLDGALLYALTKSPYCVSLSYDRAQNAMQIKTSDRTNDPSAMLELTPMRAVAAEAHRYIVLRVKTDHPSSTRLALYYAAGADRGAAASRVAAVQLPAGEGWQYVTFDMQGKAAWSGRINDLRLDIFDSVDTPAGYSVWFGGITFCKTDEEVNGVIAGRLPDGCLSNYAAFLEAQQPFPDPEKLNPPATAEPETAEPPIPETAETPTQGTAETRPKPPSTTAPTAGRPRPQPNTGSSQTQAAPTEETLGTAENGVSIEKEGCASVLQSTPLLLSLIALPWLMRKKKDQ